MDLWGAIGAAFCPGPSVGVLGLDRQQYVSRCFLVSTRSLAVIKVAPVLEGVDVTVAVLEVVIVKVVLLLEA